MREGSLSPIWLIILFHECLIAFFVYVRTLSFGWVGADGTRRNIKLISMQWHNKLNLIMKEETKQRRNENLNNYTFVLVTQSHLFCIWFSHFPHFSSKHSLFHSNPTHVSLRLAPTPTFPRIYRIPVEWVNCMAMEMYEMEKEKLYWKRITIILQHFLLPFQLFLRNKTCNILANVLCFCMFNRFNGACCILCDDVSEFVFLFCCLRWLYPECGCVCVE